MRLWIDDVRTPPAVPAVAGKPYIHCKSVNEAKAAIRFYERNMHDDTILIDLDHDAGEYVNEGGDYIELLNWLEELNIPDTGYAFHIHSRNPVGVDNMRAIINHNGWRELK